ncbi:MAG: RpiB/LacA/LacB family sugar-phosphate isomerase [Planctomycetes bacterium]|nr:RpiB/LacA/LacB family sugar-phosphate isomerase [Planctomycetota bacterium]
MTEEVETEQPTGLRFIISCDHAGFELKDKIKRFLVQRGNQVEDLQPNYPGRVDFPAVAEKLALSVLKAPDSYGVVVCGTGLGVSMAANKMPGIRSALLYNEAAARYARSHNNANVLAFGGRTMDHEEVLHSLEIFFGEKFKGGRYARRNEYLRQMEKKYRQDAHEQQTG